MNYIVLVHYKIWGKAKHWAADSGYIAKSKIVEVDNLLDLNESFKNIEDVKILENNK